MTTARVGLAYMPAVNPHTTTGVRELGPVESGPLRSAAPSYLKGNPEGKTPQWRH
jgi:hypothetical protein